MSGGQSEVAPVRSILLKHPAQAWESSVCIASQWRDLNYAAAPDLGRACAEYDAFVALVRRIVQDIRFLPAAPGTGLDSIYVRDTAVMTDRGLILCMMGKPARRGEPDAVKLACQGSGVPILGAIVAPGTLEGGDVAWLNRRTLAVGRGYRTNAEGIRQLRELCTGLSAEVVEVVLPHWKGPGDVMHLMSLLSPLDDRTLLVYSRLLPVPFREWLLGRGFRLLEVPDEEFQTMGGNVLALAPGRCVMLDGNPRTKKALESAGIEVWEYRGEEISRKGSGGPTCLTRPLLRG